MANFRDKWAQFRKLTFETQQVSGRRWPELSVTAKDWVEQGTSPRGTNQLSSMAMFDQRTYYKNYIYPTDGPSPADLWYDKLFFGKIDSDGDPIILQERFLRQIVSSGAEDVWALDFVVDAFNDFKSHFLFLNKQNSVGTIFETLDPRKGWSSVALAYRDYLNSVYEQFLVSFLSQKKREEKILDFDDFMKLFMEFIENNSGIFPITLSQFIYSPYCSPHGTGLMIDITSDLPSIDLDKYNNFINNRNFECYTVAAQQYGFKVDKNMPGRLIADVKSPAMQEYLKKYPKKPEPVKMQEPLRPEFSFRPPPLAQPDNPFEVGDNVQFAVVRPATPGTAGSGGESFYILRDYTDLSNRKHRIGRYPKKSEIGGRGMVSHYDLLKEFFLVEEDLQNDPWNRTSVQIVNAKVLKPNPTFEDRIRFKTIPGMIIGGSLGEDSAEGTGMGVQFQSDDAYTDPLATGNATGETEANETGASRQANNIDVMLVEISIVDRTVVEEREAEENEQIAMEMEASNVAGASLSTLRDGTPPVNTQHSINDQQASDGYMYKTVRRGWTSSYILEVPKDAVHLSPQANAITLRRFEERTDYQSQAERWATERSQRLEYFRNGVLADYNRLSNLYNQQVNAYEQQLEYFNNAPSLESSNFTKRRFEKVYTWDLIELKQICMQFYHIYVTLKPSVTIYKTLNCPTDFNPITKSKLMFRKLISTEYIDKNYPTEYWLKKYIQIRNFEAGNVLSGKELIPIMSQAILLLSKRSQWDALKYVNEQFKSFMLTTTL